MDGAATAAEAGSTLDLGLGSVAGSSLDVFTCRGVVTRCRCWSRAREHQISHAINRSEASGETIRIHTSKKAYSQPHMLPFDRSIDILHMARRRSR